MKRTIILVERPGCIVVYAISLWVGTSVCLLSSLHFLRNTSDKLMIMFWLVTIGLSFVPSFIGLGLWRMRAWARGFMFFAHLLMIVGLITTWVTKNNFSPAFKAQSIAFIIVNGVALGWFAFNEELFI